METSVRENNHGNWEMAIPFRRKEMSMPINLSQLSSKPLERPYSHSAKKAPNGERLRRMHAKNPLQGPRLPGAVGGYQSEAPIWASLVPTAFRRLQPKETYSDTSGVRFVRRMHRRIPQQTATLRPRPDEQPLGGSYSL